MTIKQIKREKLPQRLKIYDSNWNRGIMIGNTIIFTGKFRKETKQIRTIYQHNNDTHGYYIEYKNEIKLYIIYIRE